MFFLTNVDVSRDLARVYDTSDDTNDAIRYTGLMNYVISGKMQVVGMAPNLKTPDAKRIGNTQYFYSISYAREMLAKWFIQNRGFSPEVAYRKVGLRK